MMGLRIVTWNVNGIRNPFSYEPWRSKRTFATMFDILEADIVIFQETKIQRKDLRDDMVLIPGWDCYFSFPGRDKGKFGVVIYTRQSTCAPIRAEEGLTGTLSGPNSDIPFCELPEEQQIGGYPTTVQMINAPNAPDIAADFATLDSEGRVVILEFPAFVLFGVYAPAARDETRVAYRAGFFNLLDARIRNLVKLGKRVMLTGDLNVSKSPLDVANIEADLRKSGSTVEEYFGTASRRMFNHLISGGTITGMPDEGREEQVLWDVCRAFHPERAGMYTHWETKKNARPANFGSRIDYILCSLDMVTWFSESNIQEGLMGSDHCPVFAVINDKVEIEGQMTNILDVMNPPDMFKDGKRLREHSQRDILPASGRLIPDFTGRRSIRDMFAKRPGLKPTSTSEVSGAEEQSFGKTIESNPLPEGSEWPAKDAELRGGDLASVPGMKSQNDGKPGSASTRTAFKRTLSEKSNGSKTAKRSKSSGTSQAASPGKGQSQILGFFQPKAVNVKPVSDTAASGISLKCGEDTAQDAVTESTKTAGKEQGREQSSLDTLQEVEHASNGVGAASSGEVRVERLQLDPARDLEESKEGWAKLFSKPQVPLCEHGEPCKQMLSKKQGPNYMRWFYMCARPLGPSGDKEKGTQWRCRTFVWLRQTETAS